MTTPIRWLPHVWSRLYGPPLLIPPARLEPLLIGLQRAMLQRGSSEIHNPPVLADPVSQTASGNGSDERPHGYRIDHGVATLPIHGVLASRLGQISPDSTELQSYERLSRVVRNAHRDQRVRGILLDIDSPGGEASGVFDLADEIRAAGQTKPIWAIANHDALSAAYILASAADRIWTTQSGAVGSLGVVALHADQSEFDQQEGRRYTYIYRGARKIDGNPHSALSPEAHTTIQAEVDRNYDRMIDQVARHRRVEPRSLQTTDARIYFAGEALDRGLADRIGRVDQAHAALVEYTTPRRGRGQQMNDTPIPANAVFIPASAVGADDNVIQMHVDTATADARQAAAAIATLCRVHNVADLAAELIAEGLTVEAAGLRILERKAQDDQRRSIVPIDPSVAAARQRNLSTEVEAAAVARFAAQRRGLYRPE